MKSQILLFLQELLTEVGSWCDVSTNRDFKTISDRVEHEGLPYLMVTLPIYGQEFERALDRGQLSGSEFIGYSKFIYNDEDEKPNFIPHFLGGFLTRVFNPYTGVLRDNPDLQAIRAIRQITLMFAKVKIATSEKKNLAALDQYLACDIQVREWERDSFLDGTTFLTNVFLSSELLPLFFGLISSAGSTSRSTMEILCLSMVPAQLQSVFRETENTIKQSGRRD